MRARRSDAWPACSSLLACIIGLTFSVSPVLIGATSILLVPLSAETGWARADVSGIITAGLVSMAIGAPLAGRLVALFGARPVIIVSTIGFATSLLAMSLMATLAWGIAFACGAGLFGAGAAQTSYLSVLPLWFPRRLGLSLSIAMLGSGAGNTLMPIVVDYLTRHQHWRETYRSLAVMVLLFALPGALFLLRTPSLKAGDDKSVPLAGVTVGRAMRMPDFWQLILCFFFASTVTTAIGICLVPMLIDRGYLAAEAARMLSVFGLSMLVGRSGAGLLFDHFSARWVGVSCLVAAAIGIAVLALGMGGALTVVGVAMIALAHGMEGDLAPFLTQHHFGSRDYSTIYGLLGLVIGLGTVTGSVLMSYSYRVAGSYDPMLWASTILVALAALVLAFTRKTAIAPALIA